MAEWVEREETVTNYLVYGLSVVDDEHFSFAAMLRVLRESLD